MSESSHGTVNKLRKTLIAFFALSLGFFYTFGPLSAKPLEVPASAEVPLIARNIGNSKAIAEDVSVDDVVRPEKSDEAVLNVGGIPHPMYAAVVGRKVYVAAEGRVVVIDRSSNAVLKEILVPTGSYLGVFGDKVYVPNAASVSVIDTNSDEVVKTISVPLGATTITANGVKIYVTCSVAGSVAVIDTRTDTVTKVIPVGEKPFYGSALGTKVYISNNSEENGSVSVINTVTDQVEATIAVGAEPVLEAFYGTKLYVSNKQSASVSVIDTTTNGVIGTIPVGQAPEMLLLAADKLYTVNRSSNSVMVIDPRTDSVIKEIPVGAGPYYLTASGRKVFVGNNDDNTVSVIDTAADAVIKTLTVGYHPFYLAATDDKIYVPNVMSDFLSIITISEIDVPELMSFETKVRDGAYSAGSKIDISARFNRSLAAGSGMAVTLNTGVKVKLSEVNGELLSGIYTVGKNDAVPDLAVMAIGSASVSDRDGNTRYSYSIPYSAGSFTGENSLIARNLGDAHNIAIGKFVRIDVGANPYQISSPFTLNGRQYVYVANQGAESLSVVDIAARKEIDTVRVGSEPYGFATASISGTARFFVANTNSHSVSVVDSVLGRVIGTIQAGLKPYYAAALNTRIFVTNGQSNTVSVINAANHSVEATVPVGAYPRGIKVLANEVYVANYGDPYYYSGGNTISVLNGLTLQLTNMIVLPAGSRGPRGVAVAGSKVYVTNYLSNNVSVIDSTTKQVIATIPVGAGPRGMAVVGSKLYVENFDEGTLSVINTSTNTVNRTVIVGHSPSGITAIGSTVYISNFQDGNLLLLDSKSDSLLGAPAIFPFSDEAGDEPVNIPAALEPELDIQPPKAGAIGWPTTLSPGAMYQFSVPSDGLYKQVKGSSVLRPENRG